MIKPDNNSKPLPRSPDTCQEMYWHPVFYRWYQCGKRKAFGDYCVAHRKVLTEVEREIIAELIDGKLIKEIAYKRGLTPLRITRKIEAARRVVGAGTTPQLIAIYMREELQVETKTIEQ